MKEIDPVDRRVGQRLRGRREQLQITQERLADAVGVTFQQIQKYERGSNRVSASRLHAFCRILGVQPDYFFDAFGGSEPQLHHDDLHAILRDDPDVERINQAFGRITSRETRRAIVTFVEALGSSGTGYLGSGTSAGMSALQLLAHLTRFHPRP